MVDIQALQFGYQKKKVFDGLSLEFRPGCIYGLLGKNGTGKSTLLRNIHGLIYPDKGTIKVLGYNPRKRSPEFLRDVYMIPEEFYLPNVPIRKFVTCNAPFYPKFDLTQFEIYLREFEIPLENTLQQMSYGQKKKVLISFALACNTSLVLMDEPSNGLDIMSKSQFRKVLAAAVNEQKCIIISTHQVRDLEALIDHITIIDEGKILFDHSLEEIQRRLSFSFSFERQLPASVIYFEQALTGNAIISVSKEDDGDSSGKIDLELLYKAVITKGPEIKMAFESKHSLI